MNKVEKQEVLKGIAELVKTVNGIGLDGYARDSLLVQCRRMIEIVKGE